MAPDSMTHIYIFSIKTQTYNTNKIKIETVPNYNLLQQKAILEVPAVKPFHDECHQ